MIADSQPILTALSAYYPLSAALQHHLKQTMSQQYHQKGSVLLRPGQVPTQAFFIVEGAARSYLFDDEKGEHVTAWFWHKGDLLVAHDSFCSQAPTAFHVEVLEDSVLQSISYAALEHTVELFPSFRHLERAVVKEFMDRLFQHYQEMGSAPVKARYEKLMERQPQLFNVAQVKDIASFLGMTPNTLSRLRACK